MKKLYLRVYVVYNKKKHSQTIGNRLNIKNSQNNYELGIWPLAKDKKFWC